jgi:beta propeller repeat protein
MRNYFLKTKKLIGLTAIFIMVFSIMCGLGVKPANADTTMKFAEARLTSNPASQVNPDIYQYALNWWAAVWEDNRNGKWDIYMFSQHYLGDGNWDVQWDTPITSNSGNNVNPKIYDNTIVYQSDRNGNWDIYMYDLTSEVETQITTNTADQTNPDIDGNLIVWQDYRNGRWDIYLYDLTTQKESRLLTQRDETITNGIAPTSNPSISGNRIAFQETYGVYTGVWVGQTLTWGRVIHIECIDISTGQKYHVSNPTGYYPLWPQYPNGQVYDGPTGSYFNPAISANYVTYQGPNGGVYLKDISTSTGGLICGGSSQVPDVCQNQQGIYYTVFMDNRNGNWDIYLYDTTSSSTYAATNNAASQQNPAISATEYGNFIVYQDNRNGNWDIYLTAFWYGVGAAYPPAEPITPNIVISNLQVVKSRIVDTPTSDFAGANDKVKENRKNAMLHQLDSAFTGIEAAAYTQKLKLRAKYLQSAIDQLDSLIGKLDGWSSERGADIPGSGFTPDWITTPRYLDGVIRDCRNDLQTLLNGIS